MTEPIPPAESVSSHAALIDTGAVLVLLAGVLLANMLAIEPAADVIFNVDVTRADHQLHFWQPAQFALLASLVLSLVIVLSGLAVGKGIEVFTVGRNFLARLVTPVLAVVTTVAAALAVYGFTQHSPHQEPAAAGGCGWLIGGLAFATIAGIPLLLKYLIADTTDSGPVNPEGEHHA